MEVDAFLEVVRKSLRPPERAAAVAETLQEFIRIIDPYENKKGLISHLHVAWRLLGTVRIHDEDPNVLQRRRTLSELVQISLPREDEHLGCLDEAFNLWTKASTYYLFFSKNERGGRIKLTLQREVFELLELFNSIDGFKSVIDGE